GSAEAILPMCEQRIAFIRPERCFGTWFGSGGNIAEQRWIFTGADAAHDFAYRTDLRFERFFINGRFEDDGGFFDENLREVVGRVDIIKAAFALVSHPDHGIRSRMARNQNRTDSNAIASNGLHERLRRRTGIAIAKD